MASAFSFGLRVGVGERMDRGRHLAGHHPVVGVGDQEARWSPRGRRRCQRMVDEPLTEKTLHGLRKLDAIGCPGIGDRMSGIMSKTIITKDEHSPPCTSVASWSMPGASSATGRAR